MAARALVLAIVIVVAACSGGGQSLATQAPAVSAPPRATVSPGRTLGNFFPSFGAPTSAPTPAQTDDPADVPTATFRPSGGTLLRVANFYRSAPDEPTAIDVYGAYVATHGLLRASVPFGTISDWFDPGILDDSGDANFAFYPAGTTGPDDQVGAQSETLKGTERITVIVGVGVGDNPSPNDTPYAQWKTYFENGTVYPIPTPPVSGTAVLLVEGIGVKALPGTTETFMYLGVDGTCLPALYPGPDGGGQPVGPETQQQYIFPAGSHDITFHLAQPECSGKSAFDPVHVQLDSGQQAFLMLFSPDGTALKELFVPIQH